MKRMRKLLAALLALSGSVAFAQVNGKFQNVDAKGGYTVNGAAPNGDTLCGNGSIFVPAASCGAAAFYQTIFNSLGVAQTQEPATQFSANFALTTSGSKTGIDLTPNISVNAATATLAANSNAVGGVALSGLCQIGGAGCPVIPLTQAVNITTGICTATGGSFATCGTFAGNWPTPFSNTNYSVNCNGLNPSNGSGPTGSIAGNIASLGKSTTQVLISLQTYTSSGFSFSEIDCTATQ